MTIDECFIQRCFQLAQLGEGQVSPNPLVGAVLVHEERIIGEGWHERWGEAHAEVNCIRSVSPENRPFIPYSTLYCNLEPCAHFGKTPPCADLILQKKIPRVVVSNTDPNPLVAGKGLEKLRQSGVKVVEGLLEAEGQWLNRYFFTWIQEKRPYVILKWAQSCDGFLGKEGQRTAISSSAAWRLVHRWRAECDAILVGNKTALVDNPRLDVRHYFGNNPLRLVLDTKGKIPPEYHLLDDSAETWIYGKQLVQDRTYTRTRFIPVGNEWLIAQMLEDLKLGNRASVLVEGGENLLSQFIDTHSWDEIRVIENGQVLNAGLPAPKLPENAVLKEQFPLGADKVRIYVRKEA